MAIAQILVVQEKKTASDIGRTLVEAGYDLIETNSGEHAITLLEKMTPDLIIMGIQLNGSLDGIQTVERLEKKPPIPVIYITDFHDPEIIDRAKKTHPAVFLQQPIKTNDLLIAVEIAMHNAKSSSADDKLFSFRDRFFIKEKDSLVRVNIEDLLWIQASGSYCIIKTTYKEHVLSMSLRVFLDKFSHPAIVRVSRSYAVNIDKVINIRGNILLMENNMEIPLSEPYRDSLRQKLNLDINSGTLKTETFSLEKNNISGEPELTPSTPFSINGKASLAELVSDSEKGDDYLDVKKDVIAFSKIVAARNFRPPLAIALFGKWGSGKSFFMNQMRDQVTTYSNTQQHNAYCNGIVQIHFNAWSYLDANLWASIVTRIFEGLNEYISTHTKSTSVKKEIEKELAGKLTITSQEIYFLEKQKNAAEEQVKLLEKKKLDLQGSITDRIQQIESRTLKKIVSSIDANFNAHEKIKTVLNDNPALKRDIPEIYWQDPVKTYQQISSSFVFLKRFFSKEKLAGNILFVVVAALIIICVPLLLQQTTSLFRNINYTLPQTLLSITVIIGTLFQRYIKIKEQLLPVITSLWKIKESYEQELKDAIFAYEQEDKAIQLQIESSKSEIAAISQLIQQAHATVVDLDFKINNALATEVLRSFIDRRSKSEDYHKHLGIISIIRKDFEILSDLFDQHQEESAVQGKLDRPLERIILYIDDLDRCPEDRVVEVLEAVNLLMAFRLFIVVVGVDQRWVKNALVKRYQQQFAGHKKDDTLLDSPQLIDVSDYLEKIFQVPFHLKEASDENIKNMIRKLANPSADETDDQPNLIINSDAGTTAKGVSENDAKNASGILFSPQQTDNTTIATDKPESLNLSNHEVELLMDFSSIMSSNPRAIKRFVNIYRIIRVHEELSFNEQTKDNELLVIMFLVALFVGPYKKLVSDFGVFILEEKNQTKSLSSFLQRADDSPEKLKAQLDILLSDRASYNTLQHEPIASFRKNFAFIKRFHFDNC